MITYQTQCLLGYLGYLPEKEQDGQFGPKTQAAIRKFQTDYGLTADGVAGDMTCKMLVAAVAGTAVKVEKPGEPDQAADKPQTGTFWDEIQFFGREEFRCQCGGKYCNGFPAEPEETMVRVVDEIRRRAGVPITIVTSGGSGVRCKQHNAEVGGVANSEHLYGRAADLHSTLPPAKLKAIAETVTAEMIPGRGGIGLYSWGVHVDTGKYSRWNG